MVYTSMKYQSPRSFGSRVKEGIGGGCRDIEVDPFCLVLLGVTLSGGVVWRVTDPVLTCFVS